MIPNEVPHSQGREEIDGPAWAVGVLVAHTPVPLPRHGFRAQIWPEFSMVYTSYTLSMGT